MQKQQPLTRIRSTWRRAQDFFPLPFAGVGQGEGLSHWWERAGVRGLARDLTIIITFKVVALAVIKVLWFSDAPQVAPGGVAHNLLAPATQAQHSDPR